MTKRINWLANERVDVPDLTDGTNTLSTGLVKQFNNQAIIDKFARVANGFRVEIANQALNPGQFTIYNGYAFDRSGQLVLNEEQENASRSYTFAADATYYVEIQFYEDDSNVDARAFWDPTVDNGTYPSGDPKLPGREFYQNVATRITPDWQIVAPVSTTGFAVDSDPNTTKIPVARITVAGGVITGTTEKASTVVGRDAAIGATQLYVLDSRVFPDAFNATVDAEAVVVSSNDRTNGILYLTAATVSAHGVGARVTQTGGISGFPDLLAENATPIPPFPGSGTQDARPRFWQADESRGYALTQKPSAASGRSDVSIQSLKDEVDFLSAQLRELKFGAIRSSDVGKLAPPISGSGAYPALPRYFDRTGGVEGTRAVTFTIGDGVNSWGDFNVSQIGSAYAAFAAAYNALPAAGGTIFVKNGTYVFSNYLEVNKSFSLIGETPGKVVISTTAGGPESLVFSDDGTYVVENISFVRVVGTTANRAMSVIGINNSLTMRNCRVEGGVIGGFSSRHYFENVTFEATAGGNNYGFYVSLGGKTEYKFYNCNFVNSINVAGARSVYIYQPDVLSSFSFIDCNFRNNSASATSIVSFGDANNINVVNCTFTDDLAVAGCCSIKSNGYVSNLTLSSCTSSCLSGFVDFSAGYCENSTIDNCSISYDNNGVTAVAAIRLGSSTSNSRNEIINCKITQTGTYTVGTNSPAIYLEYVKDSSVSNCLIYDADIGIRIDTGVNVNLTACNIKCTATTFGYSGVLLNTAVSNCRVNGCIISDIKNTLDTVACGIDILATVDNLSVSNCSFQNIGSPSASANAYAVYLRTTAGSVRNLKIANNEISYIDAKSIGVASGITLSYESTGTVISGNSFYSLGLNALGASGIVARGLYSSAISNNAINSIGSPSSTSTYGILLATTVSSSTLCRNVQVTGNTIKDIYISGASGSPTTGGIVLLNTGININIIGNIISSANGISTPAHSGIAVYASPSPSTVSPQDISIVGNQIGNPFDGLNYSFYQGIYVWLDTGASASKNITITDNTITDFYSVGIYCTGNALNQVKGVLIGSNNVQTVFQASYGINVSNVTDFSVNGNVVRLMGQVAADNAVGLGSFLNYNGSISSNRISLNLVNSRNLFIPTGIIYMYDCKFVNISSNELLLTDPAGATGVGINFSASVNPPPPFTLIRISVYANHVVLPVVTPTALKAIDGNLLTGINYRIVNDSTSVPSGAAVAVGNLGSNIFEILT